MLYIRQVKHLARRLGISPRALENVSDSPERFCEELLVIDPVRPKKPRSVVNAKGILRRLQSGLYRRILLPRLIPSDHSHGGIVGRSIVTNAAAHAGSQFVFKADIADFYPTIHRGRIYRLFVERFGCSPDVARLCTRITTFNHHLTLGLITSPVLADQVLGRFDRRIGAACRKAGLVYSRFVDDVAISGSFDLKRSGFGKLVEDVLYQEGFWMNPKKKVFGRLSDGIAVTGIRIRRGRFDVRKDYAAEVERQLDDAMSLARDERFVGPYYTMTQIGGRVRFVSWVNPGRRRSLMRKFRTIPWDRVQVEACRRGLQVNKPKVAKKGCQLRCGEAD